MNPMMNPANPLSFMSPMNPSQGMWNPASPHYYTFGPGAQQNKTPSAPSGSDGDGITVAIVIGAVVIFIAFIALVVYLFD